MLRILDVTTSFVATVLRMPSGHTVGTLGKRPKQPLELYEYEGCPYCRKVREALSMLDLEAMVYPCPKGGTRFRARVEQRGGKLQFPYLVDPNTGTALYESDDIIDHSRSSPQRSPPRRERRVVSTARRRVHQSSLWSSGASRPRRSVAWYAKHSRAWSFPTSCTTSPRTVPVARRSRNGQAR
jgi:glutaredoxin